MESLFFIGMRCIAAAATAARRRGKLLRAVGEQ
jgi:hypothetical protein